MPRPPRILHCTSEPLVFFGRQDELALLRRALTPEGPSVLAFVGPGGQGKTAIVQHWLHSAPPSVDGLFFWSFYRGKDADRCLREWLAYAEGLSGLPERSASWCVERLRKILSNELWAVVLDGAEVAQHEDGAWAGRFLHPDLGALLEDLASVSTPGAVVLTSRFDLPTLTRRPYFRLVSLDRLDPEAARALLAGLGVHGSAAELDRVAGAAGRHAKAVELAGTYLVRFQESQAQDLGMSGDCDVETGVARVLGLFQRQLPTELQDVLALATSFREPPVESVLIGYLGSPAVATLVHQGWQRDYVPFGDRDRAWLPAVIQQLVELRLLERVGPGAIPVIDAHPLVRRGFEHVFGQREVAQSRVGFLRGRPDRRRPATLEEAAPAVELFHALCDAGLWSEADSAYLALENPKHRFLAPALELDLLRRFFPSGDWHQPPHWSGFGRWRSLAICLEMLGRYEDALQAYRPQDAALRGDALLALGRVPELVDQPFAEAPWSSLWQAYRCHALALVGRTSEAVRLARSLFPADVYEYVHIFEALLRADALDAVNLRSFLNQSAEGRFAELARRRMRADYQRRTHGPAPELEAEYRSLIEEFDQAGLLWERALVRLGLVALLVGLGDRKAALEVVNQTLAVCAAGLRAVEVDALLWRGELLGQAEPVAQTRASEFGLRGGKRG